MSPFSSTQGLVSLDIPPEKATITTKYYMEVVLVQMPLNWAEAARTPSDSQLLFYLDNASLHIAQTMTFLKKGV